MNIVCFGFLVIFTCQQPSPPPPVVACPSITVWTKDFQARIAKQYGALTDDMRQVLREHIQLRKQARACREAEKKAGR
jgi:hypothetical protein